LQGGRAYAIGRLSGDEELSFFTKREDLKKIFDTSGDV
jgi:hypothetical protein